MTSVYPGVGSTYVPTAALQGQAIAYIRGADAFQINRYVQVKNSNKMIGLYPKIDCSFAARLDPDTWRDGDDRPVGGNMPHKWLPYQTERRNHPFRIGQLAADQAEWDILSLHSNGAAQKAMTRRAKLIEDAVSTSANWLCWNDVTHSATATALSGSGGVWTASSESNAYIQKSLNTVVERIKAATFGLVTAKDLCLVLGNKAAKIVAESPEYKSWLKQQPAGTPALMQTGLFSGDYGVVGQVFGMQTFVENTYFVTSREGDTTVQRGIYDGLATINACALVCTKPSGVVPMPIGVPSFATVQWINYAGPDATMDLELRLKYDDDNKRFDGDAIQNGVCKVVAPETGHFITNIDS